MRTWRERISAPKPGRGPQLGAALALAAVWLAVAGIEFGLTGGDLLGHDTADTQRRVSHNIPPGTPIAVAAARLKTGGFHCFPRRSDQMVCARQSFLGFTYWSVTLTGWADQVAAAKATCSRSFL